MTPTIVASSPRELVERLHGAGDRPVVAIFDREQALGWLRCILVDVSALNRHILHLQQLSGNASFCFPSPRRDSAISQAGQTPDSRFRFHEVWPTERIAPILDGGVEVLSNEDLGQLLLNPYALAELRDQISEISPDAWLPVIQDVGREMMRREGVKPRTAPPVRLPSTQRPERAWLWALGGSLVTAACLLIAFIATLPWLRNGQRPAADLMVSATPKYGDRKGADPPLTSMDISSNVDGNVTIVFLSPESRHSVLPTSGSDEDWRVFAGAKPTSILVPDSAVEDATDALVIVTETPAFGTIAKLLRAGRYTSRDIGQVQALLKEKLPDYFYKRISITPMKIVLPKKQ